MTKAHKDMILDIDPAPAFAWSAGSVLQETTPRPEDRSFVQPLPHPRAEGTQIGWQIGGSEPGPNLFVTGERRMAGRVYRRLLRLPTIDRLRGKLFLIEPEELPSLTGWDDMKTATCIEAEIDESLHLACLNYADLPAAKRLQAEKTAYWTVLRLLKRLGMIHGRGVIDHIPPAMGAGVEPANPRAPWKPGCLATA